MPEMVPGPDPAPPRIPDHELMHPIGRGSYGQVWLARNVLGTPRAVKVVRRDDFREAKPFEREFAGIQRFEPISRSHEGLVDVLQVGRNEPEGFFYYVMELADPAGSDGSGHYVPRSLATDLQRLGRLPPADCVRLFHELALALAHLHRAGLVHRDIKPSNILFVNGVAKFADIGLVTWADDSLSYVGTEGFIPPEGAGTVTADIYSLGKVLYECGTGRDRTEFPVLPPDLAGAEGNEGFLELNQIWIRACASLPGERYQGAEELAADLALLQAGRSVKRLRVMERRLRQARRFTGAFGVVALLTTLWLLVARHQTSVERENRGKEQRLRLRAEAAEQRAQKELSAARVAQANAELQSQHIGRSAVALDLLRHPISPELRTRARSLAATALALPDLLPAPTALPHRPAARERIHPQPDGSIRIDPARPGETGFVVPSTEDPGMARDPLELSDDGRYLYAGYGRFTERLWDLSTTQVVARLDTNYYSLAFRPGSPEVAVAYVNGDLAIHRLPDWTPRQVWRQAVSEGSLSWAPDGRHLLYPSKSGGEGLLDARDGVLLPLAPVASMTTSTAWHPDGSRLAVASDDGYVRVHDSGRWSDCSILARHESHIIRTLFLPPFPWLLTSSWDGTSKLWDWHSGHELGRIESAGYDISYDAENLQLTWRLGSDPTAHPWQVNGGRFWRQLFFGNPRIIGGPFMSAFSADGRFVAAPDTDTIRVWRVESAAEVLRLPGYSQSLWINPDATRLLAVIGGALRQWTLRDEGSSGMTAVEQPALGPAPEGGKLAVNRDASVVALLTEQNLEVWDHGAHRVLPHRQAQAETLAISPDGRWLAVGTRNHIGVRVFDAVSRTEAWHADLRHGTHVAFSWDSRWLAVGTDGGCHVLEAATGKVRWQPEVPQGQDPLFWEAAFSPDGEILAWTPKPHRLQLAEAATGREILTLDYPTPRFITGLTFSPDGRWLAETSNKHSLMLWNIEALRRGLEELGLGWEVQKTGGTNEILRSL